MPFMITCSLELLCSPIKYQLSTRAHTYCQGGHNIDNLHVNRTPVHFVTFCFLRVTVTGFHLFRHITSPFVISWYGFILFTCKSFEFCKTFTKVFFASCSCYSIIYSLISLKLVIASCNFSSKQMNYVAFLSPDNYDIHTTQMFSLSKAQLLVSFVGIVIIVI